MKTMTIKPGQGFWNTQSFPIGGAFRRAPRSGDAITVEVTGNLHPECRGCNLTGKLLSATGDDRIGDAVAFHSSHAE